MRKLKMLTNKQNKKTIGFFTLSMMVIGSMIGAGLLVVPNKMMSHGFGGTLGWIFASVCSLVLARIFADISLSTNGEGGLSAIVAREYGKQAGFVSGFAQWVFIMIGSSAITCGLIDYLSEFYNITSSVFQFAIASGIIIAISLMHALTSGAMKLMSIVTILKILLFGFCALLGITEFNKIKVFGFAPSGGIISNLSQLVTVNGGLVNLFSGTLKAASIAMLAFAGLESAASAANVRNPKKNVPNSTITGLAICSFIYLFTHICVVNASGDYSATPVKSALVILGNAKFGPEIGAFFGSFVSIVAILGCFGTLLALGYVMPHILLNSLQLANSKIKSKLSRTGLPFMMSIISVIPILVILYLKYMANIGSQDMDDILLTSNFVLVYFYLQCVLAHFRGLNKKALSVMGLLAILILILGCNPKSVFYGVLIVEIIGKTIFAVLYKPEVTEIDQA